MLRTSPSQLCEAVCRELCDDELAKTVGFLCPWPKPKKLQASCQYFICSHQINMSTGGIRMADHFSRHTLRLTSEFILIPVVPKPICTVKKKKGKWKVSVSYRILFWYTNVLNVPENNLHNSATCLSFFFNDLLKEPVLKSHLSYILIWKSTLDIP